MNLDYIGGLFDADGNIIFTKNATSKGRNYTYYVCLAISNRSEMILEKVKEHFNCGSIQPHSYDSHRWSASFRSAYYVAKILVDHTEVKTNQLRLSITYDEEMREIGRKLRATPRHHLDALDELRFLQLQTSIKYRELLDRMKSGY